MSGVELAVLSAVTSVASGIAQMNAAKAQAYQYQAQANQAELQGRVQAVEYQEEANASLKQLERVMAANAARTAAANMSPFFSGSSQDLIARVNMREGVNEFTIARDNATIAEQMSKYQGAQLRTAAANTKKAARTQAFLTVGKGIVSAGEVYGTDGFGFSLTGAG